MGMAELFAYSDLERVPRWPMVTRLLALSVVLHGLFFVAVAYVPSVRSLLVVAGDFAGIEFVDADYDRSLIGQRATMLKFEPYEKLYYPGDYFGVQSPVLPPGMEDPALVAQVAPAPPPPPPVMRQRRAPRVNASEPAATPSPEASPSPEVAQADASPSPTPDESAVVDKSIEEAANKYGTPRPTINPRPFVDLVKRGKEMADKGEINLSGVVDVVVTAERNDDGTLKRETVRIDWKSVSDEKMAELAQQFLTALSESKALVMLKGAKNVRMSLKLNEQVLSVEVRGEVESAARASDMAKGIGLMVAGGRIVKKGTDEGELYNNVKATSDGNNTVLSFEMPRDAAGKLMGKMLAKQQPSGE